MRVSGLFFLFSVAVILAVPARAASPADRTDCEQRTDPNRGIAGCTRIVADATEPAGNRARAYNNRGNAYRAKGDLDRALADYDQAVALDPKYAEAYSNRANIYRGKGDPDRAIAGYTQALALDPKAPGTYNNRGLAFYATGDADRAIADFTQALSLDPKYGDAYFSRSLALLAKNALPQALADIRQANALDPKDAYLVLWLDIIGQRAKAPGHLAENSAKLDMTAWPAPVIRLYLGQATEAAVIAAAQTPNPIETQGQLCEAALYTGELLLQRPGAEADAAARFRTAIAQCPVTYIELAAAKLELAALPNPR